MGILDKIKQNFTHGGVGVELRAPSSISMQDAAVPLEVVLTTKDSAQTIKSVRVELLRETRNHAYGQEQTGSAEVTSMALAEDTQVFTLQPGETRTVQLNLIMNAGKLAAQNLPEDNPLAGIAKAFGQLQAVTQAMNHNSYTYSLAAVADVDGVVLDPGDRRVVQVVRPGDVGGGITLG